MKGLGLGLAGLLLGSSLVVAGESSDLQKQIDELKAKVSALEKKEQPAAPAAAPAQSLWTDNVKLFGDLRVRGEIIEQPDRETFVPDRQRMRFRGRLGLDARMNDEMSVRLRISTDESTSSENGGDPTSHNQTMTNYASKKAVWWDLAMFDYHPRAVEGLQVLGGKIEQPFIAVGGNEMIWNACLAPEGGAVRYARKFGDVQPIATAGGFWIRERAGSATTDTADSGLFGGQLGVKYRLSDRAYVLAGGGYYDYVHAQDFPVFDYSGGTANFGNSVSAGNTYLYDYDEAEAFLELGFPCPLTGLPVAVFADYVKNTALGDGSHGYLAGFKFGKLDKPWDWALAYDYRRVEKDAVMGAFCDSTSFGGGTDGKGHKIGAELQLMKNLWAGAYAYLDKAKIAPEDATDQDATYRRFQLDLNFKF